MEVAITFITILAALVGILSYWQQHVQEPEENKRYLVNVFEAARRQNRELHQELSNYASRNDAYEEHFMQGFSFREAIEVLEMSERELFNQASLKAIKRSRGGGKNSNFLTDRLEKHNLYLVQSRNWFKQFFT